MITAIRPYTPQVRQNQPNFQRKFETGEITKIFEKGNSDNFNNVQFFIGSKVIKKVDGALEQIQKCYDDFLKKNPDVNPNDEENTTVRRCNTLINALKEQ